MRKLFCSCSLFICLAAGAQDGAPSVKDVRSAIEGQIISFNIKPAKVSRIENLSVWNGSDSVPVRIYYPSEKKGFRIIYNIHGGALVAGNPASHENISIELAVRTGSVVVAPDYRKPPEAPFPAGLNDCELILEWIKQNASTIHGDAGNLVITGDSGGGLFATVLAIKLKKSLGAKALCLINPAADLRAPEGFYALVTNWYLQGHPATDSLASPILASDFSTFPPTLIITCEKDELKPQGEALFDKIRSLPGTRLVNIPNEDHLGGYWAAAHPKAIPALEETVRFINNGYR